MTLIELILIGIGLSMDAFAVSICKGLGMKKINKLHTVIIAVFFGGFQALMPFIGWALGRQFSRYITSIDHWIAFALLTFLGLKMILDALKEGDIDEPAENEDRLDIKELFMLAIATSIDALAVGITFAFLEVSIVPSVTIIGIVTFLFSVGGVYIGNVFGSKFKNKAAVIGGVILIAIGLKILLQHLGIF